ncbi:MAG: leucyl/phenylalanyl-tRNA--protein transferase [Planctomycetia bacterium]|nr:leucyl/phenylalanyl-tRNA--protein transferase [Planctomycetia bacterium]
MSTPKYFPPPESTDEDGFIGIGGKLTTDWLLDAYRHGIFPWPLHDGTLAWFSPDPRAVIEFDKFHVSRRLRETVRSKKFTTTIDRDFRGVMQGCASANGRDDNTWITDEMLAAYVRLHQAGHAHSVETWLGDRLVGGTYGVAINGLFAAESMFYREPDASKVALVRLVEHLVERGFALLDIQQMTPNSARFGATEIPRREYLGRVAEAVGKQTAF